ncbi:MAG: hypothetical protein ABIH28_03895 [archaeon]
MKKKAQAAMEFLMTYGWAILAAVIAIGVLGYFGVFSPGKYIAGNAAVSAPFYVYANNVKTPAGVTLELQNNGEDYIIQSVKVTGCGTNSVVTPSNAGSKTAITIVCSPVLTAGDSFKGDIVISYRKTDSTVDLTSTGTITNKVVA